MTRQKKKFQPGQELKEVFDAIDKRRDSARSKFLARKEGLREKEKRKQELKEQKQQAASKTSRKTRLKQDPSQVAEQAKAIIEAAKKQSD